MIVMHIGANSRMIIMHMGCRFNLTVTTQCLNVCFFGQQLQVDYEEMFLPAANMSKSLPLLHACMGNLWASARESHSSCRSLGITCPRGRAGKFGKLGKATPLKWDFPQWE